MCISKLLLPYMTSKERENNIQDKANTIYNMPNLQGIGIVNYDMNTYNSQGSNMSTSQGLKSSSILYRKNLSINSNSQSRNTLPISIFGTMEFEEIDSKNMYTSLLYMTNFIHNRKLESKTEKDFLFLSEFRKAA